MAQTGRSVYGDAMLCASLVNRRVATLQAAYLSDGPRSSDARAALARLRRLRSTSEAAGLKSGLDIVYRCIPEEFAPDTPEERKALFATAGSLTLYAVHQQSKRTPMAIIEADRNEEGETIYINVSFGASARRLNDVAGDIASVERRLSQIGSASSAEAAWEPLHAIVRLMRAHAVAVDYWSLARDLYLMTSPATKDRVLLRWMRDYYRSRPLEPDEGTDASEGSIETQTD